MKQSELAQLLGVTNKAVSSWETGRTDPSLETIIRLVYIFDVTADYLLGIESEYGTRIGRRGQDK